MESFEVHAQQKAETSVDLEGNAHTCYFLQNYTLSQYHTAGLKLFLECIILKYGFYHL